MDSNHRQRDYESRALPPELRHRGTPSALLPPASAQGAILEKSYRAACARAFSLRFLVRRFESATRFLLFNALQNARSRVTRLRGCLNWLRRSDSNRRPSGYEPDELPLLHSAV